MQLDWISFMPNFPLAKLPVPSKLIASSLAIALLGNAGIVIAEGVITPAPNPQTEAIPKKKTVSEQLIGKWQTKDKLQVLTLIFTAEGKLFLIIPHNDESFTVVEMGYKIDPTTQPMNIDVAVSSDETALTIFELTNEGKLHLELDGVTPGKPRPTAFSSASSLFEKISEDTTLPKKAELVQLESPTQTKQKVAIQYVSLVNKAQQDYYLQKGKFATDVEELGIITNLETENYRYQILSQSDRTQRAIVTAEAKKDAEVASYTGAVFATKVDGKMKAIAVICETDSPSTSPPGIPTILSSKPTEFQCPAGSRILR
jgi:type II secretory pathway pseudopilin PulG